MSQARSLMLSCAVLILILYDTAYAYLDPGTGSWIIQVILASLFGAALSIRVFWANIRAFIVRRFSKDNKDQEDRGDEKH